MTKKVYDFEPAQDSEPNTVFDIQSIHVSAPSRKLSATWTLEGTYSLGIKKDGDDDDEI